MTLYLTLVISAWTFPSWTRRNTQDIIISLPSQVQEAAALLSHPPKGSGPCDFHHKRVPFERCNRLIYWRSHYLTSGGSSLSHSPLISPAMISFLAASAKLQSAIYYHTSLPLLSLVQSARYQQLSKLRSLSENPSRIILLLESDYWRMQSSQTRINARSKHRIGNWHSI